MSEKLPKQKIRSRKQSRLIRENVRVGETYRATVLSGGCLEVKAGKTSGICYGVVVGKTSIVFRAVSPVLQMEWLGKSVGCWWYCASYIDFAQYIYC